MRNLEDRVSFFGLQDRFDEFVVLLAELLGLPDVFYKTLNKTPSNAAKVSRKQTEELKELLAEDIAFYEGAVQLYQGRAAALPFDLAAGVKAFKQEEEVISNGAMIAILEPLILVNGFGDRRTNDCCRYNRRKAGA